jgi:hypothetical protein
VTVLTRRELNRATLDRQMLLTRARLSVPAAVERLVGMQAQAPFPPYTGLWTRLVDFRPDDLATLLLNREVVRIALMRGTVHLVTAADCLRLRPVLQSVLDRFLRSTHSGHLDGLDLADLTTYAREQVDPEPLNSTELTRRLMARWPGRDRQALANAVRTALPLVQVPPRAVWGRSGHTVVTTAGCWLGRPLAEDATPDETIRRYLGAFGPASVPDVQKWSGLAGIREVIERLRPGLVAFQDEDGTELFDLPDAPRPGPDTPAPVRFLPEFDNLLLSYADGSRIVAAEHRPRFFTSNGIVRSALLVDGVVAGRWKINQTGGAAVLDIEPIHRLSKRNLSAVSAEGARLLKFTTPEADHDIRFHSATAGAATTA